MMIDRVELWMNHFFTVRWGRVFQEKCRRPVSSEVMGRRAQSDGHHAKLRSLIGHPPQRHEKYVKPCHCRESPPSLHGMFHCKPRHFLSITPRALVTRALPAPRPVTA
jgi:hypothetical protein